MKRSALLSGSLHVVVISLAVGGVTATVPSKDLANAVDAIEIPLNVVIGRVVLHRAGDSSIPPAAVARPGQPSAPSPPGRPGGLMMSSGNGTGAALHSGATQSTLSTV